MYAIMNMNILLTIVALVMVSSITIQSTEYDSQFAYACSWADPDSCFSGLSGDISRAKTDVTNDVTSNVKGIVNDAETAILTGTGGIADLETAITKDINTVNSTVNNIEQKIEALDAPGSIFDDIKKDIEKILNDIKNIGKDVAKVETAVVDDIKGDVDKVKTDVGIVKNKIIIIEGKVISLEQTVVNDIKTDVNDIKEDVSKITEFIKADEKKLKEFVKTVERLEKLLEDDVFQYFWYIVGSIIAILAGILGIKIYESYRKHEVIDAILEMNKNLAKIANKNQSKTSI